MLSCRSASMLQRVRQQFRDDSREGSMNAFRWQSHHAALVLRLLCVLSVAFSMPSWGQTSAAAIQAELDALVKAARTEGELTFYTGAPENVAKRAGEAFTKKYGVKTQFIRLSGTPMLVRFSSEAASGNFAA